MPLDGGIDFAGYTRAQLDEALTLGLYWPWAQVHLARYRMECLAVDGSLDQFASAAGPDDAGAMGEELAEALDLDFGF
jgi:uncharacterized membrane protein YjgN (DUF898 family)